MPAGCTFDFKVESDSEGYVSSSATVVVLRSNPVAVIEGSSAGTVASDESLVLKSLSYDPDDAAQALQCQWSVERVSNVEVKDYFLDCAALPTTPDPLDALKFNKSCSEDFTFPTDHVRKANACYRMSLSTKRSTDLHSVFSQRPSASVVKKSLPGKLEG